MALVIVDRAGWHMTKAICCFSNVTLLPSPPYSLELNPVEQLWQQIKQRFLSKSFFSPTKQYQKEFNYLMIFINTILNN
jgi:transposase